MKQILSLAILLATCGSAVAQGVSPTYCPPHQWLDEIMGIPSMPACSQPAFSDLSGTVAAGQMPAGSPSGLADPSATIGTSVAVGTATTAMRSDAAPALSQAITPTWTGQHTFGVNTKFSFGTYSGYIQSGTTSDALNITAGAYNNGSAWVATGTLAGLWNITNTGISFQTATGLTPGNTFSFSKIPVSYTTAGGWQAQGTAGSEFAQAGFIGELIQSNVFSGSAVALTSTTAKTVASITLTPGDWDVWILAYFSGATTTTVTSLSASFGVTSNAMSAPPNVAGLPLNNMTAFNMGTWPMVTVGPLPVNVTNTQTYYYVALAQFGTSTCSAYGSILARRRR